MAALTNILRNTCSCSSVIDEEIFDFDLAGDCREAAPAPKEPELLRTLGFNLDILVPEQG
jgi:hypothetical protein